MLKIMKFEFVYIKRLSNIGALLAVTILLNACQFSSKYKSLIINPDSDGQERSEVIATILEKTDLFKVQTMDASETEMFQPVFTKYDLVVLTGDGKNWSDEVQNAFTNYVEQGGAVIFHHPTAHSYNDWETYSKITGIQGWGFLADPDIKYIFEIDPKSDAKQNIVGSTQTIAYSFVVHHNSDHPITQGLPNRWMHAEDDLFNYLQGSGFNGDVLANAYSDTTYNGSGRYEPVLFTNTFGEGRIFQTALAHNLTREPGPYHCAGFIVTLQRGAEWAVTGSVSQPLPMDFPNSASTMTWSDYEPLTIDELFTKASSYEYGKSRMYLSDISERIRHANSMQEDLGYYENKMIEFLNSDVSVESKNYMMQELSWMGTEACIPTLKEMASHNETMEMAQFAMQRLATQSDSE